jgi:hypothetical protein
LFLLACCFLPGRSQVPIILSFSGEDIVTHQAIPLDSLKILNLTENCDTTLSGTAPSFETLATWPFGIQDLRGKGFGLDPRGANPFHGDALAALFTEAGGTVRLTLTNTAGTILTAGSFLLKKGGHLFRIRTAGSELMMLTASGNRQSETIKLVSETASGGKNQIEYCGILPDDPTAATPVTPTGSGFIFYLGNILNINAYSSGYYPGMLTSEPENSTHYTFFMTGLPQITTTPVSGITQTTAESGGTITPVAFDTAFFERGVCWNTTGSPVITDDHTHDGSGNGTFISTLTALMPNTQYFVRAYFETNTGETGYGDELPFSTLAPIEPPVVTTDSVTNILTTSARCGGNVISGGSDSVSARGVCWSMLPGPNLTDAHTSDGSGVGSFTSQLTALTPDTLYYVRAYAVSTAGIAYGNEKSFTTAQMPGPPVVITTHISGISQFAAHGGGNVTSDGGDSVTHRGVCWSLSANPTLTDPHSSDSSGLGSFSSHLTGLTDGTPYHVRAYAINSVDTTYGNDLTFTTFLCGTVLTVNHLTGNVAPVDKSVSYATVKNIPGEESKCWILHNLGSDHVASAVDDATEASAGWYFQFNRKQGYMHDGTSITPSLWNNTLSENSDWIQANDPCRAELGNAWRVPTFVEWANMFGAGSWMNWYSAWGSGLYLHAAGNIRDNGVLSDRGVHGYYWSSEQGDDIAANNYDFFYSGNILNQYYKSYGFTLRCVID